MKAGRPEKRPAPCAFAEAKKREATVLAEIGKLRALGYSFSWSEYGFKVGHVDDPVIVQKFTLDASGKSSTERVAYRQANLEGAYAAAAMDYITRIQKGIDNATGD